MVSPAENRKEMEKILQEARANAEHYEMIAAEVSKMLYIRYTTLQDAGFTKDQAFEIVKARGMGT